MPFEYKVPEIEEIVEGTLIPNGDGETVTFLEESEEQGTAIFKVLFVGGSSEYYDLTGNEGAAEDIRQGTILNNDSTSLHIYIAENGVELTNVMSQRL